MAQILPFYLPFQRVYDEDVSTEETTKDNNKEEQQVYSFSPYHRLYIWEANFRVI